MTSDPLVSVIIPVLHDAVPLERLLRSLDASEQYEVIVANGDGGDVALASLQRQFPGVDWVESQPGRARQMNEAAQIASGRWLFFVHADAGLDPTWLTEFVSLETTSVIGGAFRFRLASSALSARLIEWGVALRVRWLSLPYGDQGLFVRREVFEKTGGFADLPIMEDIDLVRRLRRVGRLVWSAVPIEVSPRRWERDGWIRRSILNVWLVALYAVGVSPERLARRYYRSASGSLGRTRTDDTLRSPPRESLDGTGDTAVIHVLVPALNEEAAIGQVLQEMPSDVNRVVVVDNGSTDRTADVARASGAQVVFEPRRGYGQACLTGLRATDDAEIVVFLDADRSDYPSEIAKLVTPIRTDDADLVLGARAGAGRPLTARIGTGLCLALINRIWAADYRDLGPFRAVRRSALNRLRMSDTTWGWTIEMQVKAVEAGLRVIEMPVRQRPRIGQSKISGTVVGSVRAGGRMLWTIWTLWRTRDRRSYA